MIPVFIAPHYNRPDLLQDMLDSIDVPIDTLLVIDNSPEGLGSDLRLPAHRQARVIRGISSFGYGGSINLGVTQMADSPWWMWASNDLVFGRGDLANIAGYMESAGGARFVTYGFTYGAINREAWTAIGPVDEWSFFPIYFDDNDYHYRCQLADVEQVNYLGSIVHGDEGKGSLTIRSDPDAAHGNNRSFVENRRRYVEKWGGMPGEEQFRSPWDSGLPVWFTRPDIEGRARRQW